MTEPAGALGRAYWVAFWIVLPLMVLGALVGNLGPPFLSPLVFLAGALWLAAISSWGRHREREAAGLAPEAREAVFRGIRRWCRGALVLCMAMLPFAAT